MTSCPPEDSYLSSPASTPDTSVDEEKFLVNRCVQKLHTQQQQQRPKWYHYRNFPLGILTVSLCQVIFHVYSTPALNKFLRFEPSKRYDIWRYVTYMLVHDDWSHLGLNVVIQCLFAFLLELSQGRLRVLAIYMLGGVTGVLGAACIHPDLVVGASAGGYSLLLSNVADLILNYETINYKLYRAGSIGTLILFDVVYDIVHVCWKREPQVSWQAHFFGGLTGMFLGLVLFKCKKPNAIRKVLFSMGLTFYLIFVISFVVLTIQIGRCTTRTVLASHVRSYRYLC